MPNDDNFLSFPNERKPFIHASSYLRGDRQPKVQSHLLIGSDSVKSNSFSNIQEESISRYNIRRAWGKECYLQHSFLQPYRCFKEFVNISDDVMLIGAYFYIDDWGLCSTKRVGGLGGGRWKDRSFLKAFLLLEMNCSRIKAHVLKAQKALNLKANALNWPLHLPALGMSWPFQAVMCQSGDLSLLSSSHQTWFILNEVVLELAQSCHFAR